MTMHVQIDNGLMKKAIKTFMKTSAPIMVLTTAALMALNEEAGSPKGAAKWLFKQSTKHQKPIAVHYDGETTFMAPRGWTQEKLKGYIGVHHEALEAQFGEITGFTKGMK